MTIWGLALGTLLFVSTSAGAADEPDAEPEDALDETHERWSESVLRMATGIDNFFSNERHEWTTDESRLTLRGDADWIDHHGWEFKPDLRLYLALPGVSERLRLVVNDQDERGAAEQLAREEDEADVALRFIGTRRSNFGAAYDAGLSTRDDTFQAFGRVNLYARYSLGETWAGRSENRIYWYTSSGWRNDFRQYFERKISERFFFRSRSRVQYDEAKQEGIYPQQIFSLFQRISDRTVLAYEAIAEEYCGCDAIFDLDEQKVLDDEYTAYSLGLRFRQNVKYEWLFYELWPTVGWPEERDYEATPAIRFRLEIILGNPPQRAVLYDE